MTPGQRARGNGGVGWVDVAADRKPAAPAALVDQGGVLCIPPDTAIKVGGERRGDWGITFTGRQFWPADPRPSDICVEDIAHALSLLCRFGGHCRSHYSVAQHSVLVSMACRREHALIGLLHDAAEAYLGDVIKPVKRELRAVYKPLELRWALAIGQAFGIGDALVELPEDVERADHIVLVAERRDLLPPREWPEEQAWAPPIAPWIALEAELAFLNVFRGRTAL